MRHLRDVAVTRWGHAIADDFFSKQLPHNVTWVLTLLYALDRSGDFEQVRFCSFSHIKLEPSSRISSPAEACMVAQVILLWHVMHP